MSLTSDQITALNFKDFYGQIRPYLCGSAHGGFTPIGTVISVMGKTAPLNYLVCDGTVYNIADYPELASYFTSQFNSANFFGGDGTTTFAVPDLRGEFLRGTGTNSHPRSGDGADVGIHQEGTMNPFTMVLDNTTNNASQIAVDPTLSENPNSSALNWWGAANADYKSITNNKLWRNPTTTSGTVDTTGTFPSGYVARPTNTSVLYCIATKNIFMDAGSNYSTDELVVGTWIDGKPIYQKTTNYQMPSSGGGGEIANPWGISNVDKVISLYGRFTDANGYSSTFNPWYGSRFGFLFNASTSTLAVQIADAGWIYGQTIQITIQYTKTTD